MSRQMWLAVAMTILSYLTAAAADSMESTMLMLSKPMKFDDFAGSDPVKGGSGDFCENVLESEILKSPDPVSDEELDEIETKKDPRPGSCNLRNRAALKITTFETTVGSCTFQVAKKYFTAEKWDGSNLKLIPDMKFQPDSGSTTKEIHYSIVLKGKKFAQLNILCPEHFNLMELNDALSKLGFTGHISISPAPAPGAAAR